MAHQRLVFEAAAQKELLKGAKQLADAVSSTMGPSGHSVIIDRRDASPSITKDGVTVARAINLKDSLQSMGAELLKEVASKTNDIAGDGTTTATVLGFNLLKEGHKIIATGRSSIALKKGMDDATQIVLEFLKDNCIPVKNKQDIVNVGTISANGDSAIGELIAEAIESVGSDGLITVEPAKSVKTTLKISEGIQLDSGFLSPFFMTNASKQDCELNDPYVLITSNKISTIADILPLLEQIEKAKRPVLIVADDVEGEALHMLVVNNNKKVLQVCAVKAPSYGENRADVLADLSVVVGGVVLGATSELSLKNVKAEHLGRCKKVIVNRKKCTFLVDANEDTTEKIQKRAEDIKNALLTDTTLDELRLHKFRERLARLSGGIAVIQVGGSTEVEIYEKKDRVEDAVNATQAATQEGIVPGGGTALFYASQHLKSMIKAGFFGDRDDDEIAGINVIANVCETPFRTIVENTGVSADIIADKLCSNWAETKKFSVDTNQLLSLSEEDLKEFFAELTEECHHKYEGEASGNKEIDKIKIPNSVNKFKFGYNAAEEEYKDLVEAGIIDPVKVTRCALEHATSVVGLMLTCNAVIVNEEEPDDPGTY
jgi:chaperonin GroEL